MRSVSRPSAGASRCMRMATPRQWAARFRSNMAYDSTRIGASGTNRGRRRRTMSVDANGRTHPAQGTAQGRGRHLRGECGRARGCGPRTIPGRRARAPHPVRGRIPRGMTMSPEYLRDAVEVTRIGGDPLPRCGGLPLLFILNRRTGTVSAGWNTRIACPDLHHCGRDHCRPRSAPRPRPRTGDRTTAIMEYRLRCARVAGVTVRADPRVARPARRFPRPAARCADWTRTR